MEQAINTFIGGLSLDTNPMVQNNETLTDALNATVVTMNGNEVILQNDMGNRRVNGAYLPPGYEPVGIKEHGGIIYVASYNPITGKSQLGSFPSPQRRFGLKDIDATTLNCSNFKSKAVKIGNIENLSCLDNESVLIPLSKKNNGNQNESRDEELEFVLHAGDKFIVWSQDLYDNNESIFNKNNITNFDNVNANKIKSPKNKLFTLAIGIMNSQNEFVDITSSLVRWGSDNNIINKNPDKSDKYHFNEGYFIAPNKNNNDFNVETISDQEYIENRQIDDKLISSANTYAYKLVGPLYLKATINHIQNFNYNMEGYFSGNKLYLWIFSTITYNCPDGITEGDGDDEYDSYEIQSNWSSNVSSWYDLYIENQKLTFLAFNQSKTSYNKETNLYTAQNRRLYIIKGKDNNNIITKNSKLNYTIAVKINSEVENYNSCQEEETNCCLLPQYIEGLSSSGVIDISKLGTGEIELQGWRFYNYPETRQTILTYELGAYPKYGKKFKGLSFKISNVEENNVYYEIASEKSTGQSEETHYKVDLPANNGKTTIILDWDKFRFLEFRKLYKVEIKSLGEINSDNNISIDENNSPINEITISNENNDSQTVEYPIISEQNNLTRWILTTKLMNNSYNIGSNYFIQDYGFPHNDDESNILSDLLTIKTKNIFSYIDDSKLSEIRKTYYEDSNGNLAVDGNEKYEYYWIKNDSTRINSKYSIRWEHTLNLDVQLESRVIVDQIELYPDYILENQSYQSKNYSIDQNYPYTTEQEIEIIRKGDIGEFSPDDFVEVKNIAISSINNNNTLNGQIILYDWFKCSFVENNRPIIYPMDRVSKHLLELVSSSKTFGGVGLDNKMEDGNNSLHFLNFYPPVDVSTGRPMPIRCIDDYDQGVNPHADRLNGEGIKSNKLVFNKNQYGDIIMSELNKFPSNQMLAFCFGCNGFQPSINNDYSLGNSYTQLVGKYGNDGAQPTAAWYGTQLFTNSVEYINFLKDAIHLRQDGFPAWPTVKYCARVWWRGVNGRWSLIDDVFNAGQIEYDDLTNSTENQELIPYYLNCVPYYKHNDGVGSIDDIQNGIPIHEGLWKYSNESDNLQFFEEVSQGTNIQSPWKNGEYDSNNGNTIYKKLTLTEKLACLIYDKVLNKKDFLYCYTNELGDDEDPIYIPNRIQCAYNHYYTSNIIIPINFNYQLKKEVQCSGTTNHYIEIDNYNNDSGNNNKEDNVTIKFTLNKNPLTDNFNYSTTMESDKNFEKYTSLYTGSGALSNIFIETGDIVNSYGEYFKPQLIYPIKFDGTYSKGNIIFIDKFDSTFITDINNPFQSILVSRDGQSVRRHNNRNILLYARNNPGNPYYLYDVICIFPNVTNKIINLPLVEYDHTCNKVFPGNNETYQVDKINKGLTAMSYTGFNIVKYDK